MKIRALRGVCVGIDRHLVAGEIVDVDDGTSQFLVSIGAVEVVTEAPKPPPAFSKPIVEVQSETVTPVKKAGRKEK
jgi:hypothetical protein